ncbi:hypothetical protein D9M70_653400 [compost metagenome]
MVVPVQFFHVRTGADREGPGNAAAVGDGAGLRYTINTNKLDGQQRPGGCHLI